MAHVHEWRPQRDFVCLTARTTGPYGAARVRTEAPSADLNLNLSLNLVLNPNLNMNVNLNLNL